MKRQAVTIGTLLLLFSALYSNPIKLTNGVVIKGKIFSSNDTSVVIMDERGNVTNLPVDSLLVEKIKPPFLFASGIDLGSAVQSLIFGNFGTGVNLEISIGRMFSFDGMVYLGSDSPYYTTVFGSYVFNKTRMPNMMIGLDFRWYPGGSLMKEFWLSAGADIVVWIDANSAHINYFPLITAGYKFLFGQDTGFYMEPFLGIGYNVGLFNVFGLRAGWMWK